MTIPDYDGVQLLRSRQRELEKDRDRLLKMLHRIWLFKPQVPLDLSNDIWSELRHAGLIDPQPELEETEP